MAAMAGSSMRSSYEKHFSISPFYSGGKIHVMRDGCHVMSMCYSSVKMFNLSTLTIVKSFEEEEDTPLYLSVSPDESMLIVSWRSLLVKQYDLSSDMCIRQWKGHLGPVVAMDIDTSSTLLATGSGDASVKVWDLIKQYCTHNFKSLGGVVSLVRFHPQELLLFTSSTDCNIRIWDLLNSKCLRMLTNHVSLVTCLGFSEDGQSFYSGGHDQVINCWQIESSEPIKSLPTYEAIEGLVVLPARRKGGAVAIATVGDKGSIKTWDMTRGTCISSDKDLSSDNLSYVSLQYVREGNKLMAVVSDQSLVYHSLEDDITRHYVGHLDEILDIKCVGNLIAVATNNEVLKVYDRSAWTCDLYHGHRDTIMCLAANGTMVVTGSKDNTVRVWRVEPDGAGLVCCGVGRGHTMSVAAVSCSKSGNHFIVSGSEDQTIKLWSLDISSQSKWTLNTSFTAVAHKKDINSLDVSPNDKLIVSGSHDKTAKIWSVRDGALIGTLKGHKRGVWSVQFSPVDQCVLTSSTDSTIKLWSVSSCSCLKTFEGHTQSVLKAVFISRGLQIASVDNNGILKIWNIKDNDCVCTVDGHTDRVWALTSSDNGSFLLTGGNDSTLHIWKDVTVEVLEREREEKILLVENEQKLMNLLQVEDYMTAVGVAIDLAQPTRLYDILTKIIDESGFDGDFVDTVTSLNEAQMKTLLDYVIQWNSNSKHCRIAQAVLNVILRVAPACIARVPELMAYTEKHFQRLSKIYMLSTFLDIVR